MTDTAIAVLTRKSADEIIASGGSASWVLNARNARAMRYLVCVRNGDNDNPGSDEPHGTAFLIGLISGLRELPPDKGVKRWRILLSAYARINEADVWKGWRNPVRYTTLSELGIAVDETTFEAMPAPAPDRPDLADRLSGSEGRKLTIAEAKQGLALMFGVDPEAVEITIRG